MNDFQTYGSDEKKAERWERVVRALDDWFPQWRGVSTYRAAGSDEAAAFLGDGAVYAIRKLSGKDGFSSAFPAGQASVHVPDHSTWDGSYTKRVVDRLLARASHVMPETQGAITDATSLLAEYHRTQHEVYEKRDAAREELDAAREELEQAKSELEQMEADRDRLRELLDEATGEKYREPLRDAIIKLSLLDRNSAVRVLSDHGASTVSNVKADKLKDVLRATLARTVVLTRNAASDANQRAADAYEAFQKSDVA